jgi:hypothetical protein
MDLGTLAGIMFVDVAVVAALAVLALAMWVARRYVGVLLHLVPVAAAALGTLTAYSAWRLGEQLSWDTPGSPGLMILFFVLGGGIVIGLAGWTALGLQIKRLASRRHGQPKARVRETNALKVAVAIVVVVGSLFSAYRYYRSHQSSHDADILRLAYSPDGTFLYSLDQSGVLKKWNVHYHFEVRRWRLPDADVVAAMLVSADGKTLVALHGAELRSWGLTASPEAALGGTLPDVVALVPIDDASFVAVRAHDLSLRAYADIATPKSTAAVRAAALSAAACGDRKIVVGTDDSQLRFYAVTSGLDEVVAPKLPPLQVLPRQIRSDRAGSFVAVAGGGRMVVLDLQNDRQDPVAAYWVPAVFEISGAGELLLGRVEITGYELTKRSTAPIFNHGGLITALAVSPRDDDFAIANRHEIWVRADSRNYAAPEVRLNGRAELPLGALRVRVAALFGARNGY